ADEGRYAVEGRRDQRPEDDADQHQRTGADLHLPQDVDRLAAVERDRQPGFLPRFEAAIKDVGFTRRGHMREASGIAASARTGATMKDEHPVAVVHWRVRVD